MRTHLHFLFQNEHGIARPCCVVCPLRVILDCCLGPVNPRLHVTLVFASIALIVAVRFVCTIFVIGLLVLILGFLKHFLIVQSLSFLAFFVMLHVQYA